uniref:Uncharacterized protein n=1 Tax=Romanomermis culicivorax TaxID=13658 RepID=A0A915KCQ8_ROMCU
AELFSVGGNVGRPSSKSVDVDLDNFSIFRRFKIGKSKVLLVVRGIFVEEISSKRRRLPNDERSTTNSYYIGRLGTKRGTHWPNNCWDFEANIDENFGLNVGPVWCKNFLQNVFFTRFYLFKKFPPFKNKISQTIIWILGEILTKILVQMSAQSGVRIEFKSKNAKFSSNI